MERKLVILFTIIGLPSEVVFSYSRKIEGFRFRPRQLYTSKAAKKFPSKKLREVDVLCASLNVWYVVH